MIDFLIKLLPYIAPAIRYVDNPQRNYWRLDLLIYALIVYALDVILAHVFFSPQKGEWTISHTLARTVHFSLDSLRLAMAIDAISPGHIKVIL